MRRFVHLCRDGVMRCAFDELPTAHGGLDDPVVWISVGTWVCGVHIPVKRQLGCCAQISVIASANCASAAGEVRGLQRDRYRLLLPP